MFLSLGFALFLPTLTAARSPYDVPQAEWDALNVTVGGRLGRAVPISRSCFSLVGINVTGTQSSTDCSTVQGAYLSDEFRITRFGQALNTQFEICQKTGEGCLLDPYSPTNSSAYAPPKVCSQGNIPPFYINVRDAEDVKAGFAFSKRTGVPLSIKNTGHDYAGRSTATGTLSLWTTHVKSINYSTSFIPEGCPTGTKGAPVVTYGAGESFQALYDFAEEHNITFVGGSAKTVGAAGGWVQGGGHSILSNTYGLGVDRVRQFRVVTPDGTLRTANACQNTDLFWALRGGGGGTFGVVLEASSEVVPRPVSTISLFWQWSQTPENVKAYLTLMVTYGEQWSKEGWGGYIFPTTSILTHPTLNATQATASLKPLTDFLSSSANGTSASIGSFEWKHYDSFKPLGEDLVETLQIPIGFNFGAATRLIPDTLFSPTRKQALVEALVRSYNYSSGQLALFFTTPYSYKATSDTSVMPAWRNSVWHALVLTAWPYNGGPSAANNAYNGLTTAVAPLRVLTPGGGAYQNEADVYEPEWSTSFWGTNYPKLLELKRRYDPNGLLDCWHCVGWKGKNTPIASCYL